MVPALDTIDAIYSIMEKLINWHWRNNRTAERKTTFWSLPFILQVGAPAIFLVVALILGGISLKVEDQNAKYCFRLGAYILLLLIYLSYITGLFISAIQIFRLRHEFSPRNILRLFIERIRNLTRTDAPHVTELFAFLWQDLQYVLVELKTERAALERRIGTLVGALEKIGIAPGLVAVFAAIARLSSDLSSPWSSWIQWLAFSLPFLYIIGMFAHLLMIELDRGIVLLEMVIDTKKSDEDDPDERREPIC